MKVGVLADPGNADGSLGGAELSLRAICKAAPKGVELVGCDPGNVVPDLDRYLIGNCVSYTPLDLEPMGDAPRIKRIADVWPDGNIALRRILLDSARLIFSSPRHIEKFPHEVGSDSVSMLPPPIDLQRYRLVGGRKQGEGTVWLGSMQSAGKGLDLAVRWANENEPVDFYGFGGLEPQESERVRVKGPVKPSEVAETLSRYERFLFLPIVLEPFGRAVVEAWAAGCKLVVNRNIGALHWIENDPQALETAAEDIWEVVLA